MFVAYALDDLRVSEFLLQIKFCCCNIDITFKFVLICLYVINTYILLVFELECLFLYLSLLFCYFELLF
jgi:hypothetical protein